MKKKESPSQERREWLKESLHGMEENAQLCNAVEYVMVMAPAEARPLAGLKKFLMSRGVTKRKATAIVAWRKAGREWKDIWEEASEMQEASGVVTLPTIRKLIRLAADGKHEWDRVEIHYEWKNLNEGVRLTPVGWKKVRKAFERGGYEAATSEV